LTRTDAPPAAFLDRDGTIIEEVNYLHRPEQVRLIPGVRESLSRLRQEGVALVLVTNQSGVARGYFTPEDVHAVHAHLEALLGLRFDGTYACFHHPHGEVAAWAGVCACRKPAPGMLLEAARDLQLDMAGSAMFGDKVSDLGAGRSQGIPSFLVRTGHGANEEPAAHRAGYPVHADVSAALAVWRGWNP
jgi:D-glycero-D-manno-heptose 1,7-bisphosphate phosphatase